MKLPIAVVLGPGRGMPSVTMRGVAPAIQAVRVRQGVVRPFHVAAPCHLRSGDFEPNRQDQWRAFSVITKTRREPGARAMRQRLQQARALVKSGELDKAMSAFQSIQEHAPDHPAPLLGLGAIHLRRGDNDAAEKWLTQASTHEETRASACSMLAKIAEQRGKSTDALALYRSAIAANPKLGKARLDLARLLIDQGEVESAVAALREALRYNPQSTATVLLLARALETQGLADQAVAVLDDMAERAPDVALLQAMKGRIFGRLGQYEPAIGALQKAVALAPQAPRSHIMLAQALTEVGRSDEAVGAYREALALEPESHVGRMGLARLHLERKEYEDARKLLCALSHGQRALGAVHFMLGQVYAAQGNHAQAALEFEAGSMHTSAGVKARIPEIEDLMASDLGVEEKVKKYLDLVGKIREAEVDASPDDDLEPSE